MNVMKKLLKTNKRKICVIRRICMSRDQLIKKFPSLFLECIKEGIELCLHGHTEINNINDVNSANAKIKERTEFWNKMAENENEFVNAIT